jgi:Xaa-Pro aminopeptidase
MITEIPLIEREDRIKKIQNELNKRNLDAYLVHSTESDFANVLYLSNHWPAFETAGVIIPKEGEPVLLIGPEAKSYAESRSTIKDIKTMIEYRESAEPDYPDISLSSFEEIFSEINNSEGVKKLGLGDFSILSMPVYTSVKFALGKNSEIIRAEDIITNLRIIKSENEINLIRKAHQITEKVLDEVLGKIKPDMTEKEVVGIVLESIYKNGAECEAFPQYVFSGRNTKNAISRTTYNKLGKDQIIQINIGARYGGYSSAIGRPLVIGQMSNEMKKLVKFGLDSHLKTYEWIKEGVLASDIAKKFKKYFKEHGYEDYYLYGPCHGSGIIEVERPWMETSSDYELKRNMTFMADTFVQGTEYGFRWEDGFRVTNNGVEVFSDKWQKIIEL